MILKRLEEDDNCDILVCLLTFEGLLQVISSEQQIETLSRQLLKILSDRKSEIKLKISALGVLEKFPINANEEHSDVLFSLLLAQKNGLEIAKQAAGILFKDLKSVALQNCQNVVEFQQKLSKDLAAVCLNQQNGILELLIKRLSSNSLPCRLISLLTLTEAFKQSPRDVCLKIALHILSRGVTINNTNNTNVGEEIPIEMIYERLAKAKKRKTFSAIEKGAYLMALLNISANITQLRPLHPIPWLSPLDMNQMPQVDKQYASCLVQLFSQLISHSAQSSQMQLLSQAASLEFCVAFWVELDSSVSEQLKLGALQLARSLLKMKQEDNQLIVPSLIVSLLSTDSLNVRRAALELAIELLSTVKKNKDDKKLIAMDKESVEALLQMLSSKRLELEEDGSGRVLVEAFGVLLNKR